MAQITWTQEAQQWLRDIHDYIAIDDSASAHRTVLNIFSKVQLLTTYPELGKGTKRVPRVKYEYFFMVIIALPI